MRVVTNPPFDRPAGLAMLEAQRRAGVKIRADGAATLHCIITDKGRLSDCQVAREAPEGGGSAALALKIAKEIRLLPVGPDGLPTAGALVRMPFQFRMPFEIRPAK
ncbi:hypothetical protein LRS10_12810 [Phenylobacterium sp. J426]|uniref:hypothetical protein n=1 Tax=Phenylobacterium sp. J426 TaxID=2898439 RepID=UPI002151AD28|nr:hypothetical protein [Phenylobacterium sp. J426]MCR5874980.1 hypothetical protein [Phenylobacterium sp. J426]